MMAKSADDRPQSMAEVIDTISDLSEEADTMVRAPIEPTPEDMPRVSAEITTVADPVRSRLPDRRVLLAAAAGSAMVVTAVVLFLVLRGGSHAQPAAPKVVVAAIDAAPEIDARVVTTVVDAAVVAVDEVGPLRLQCAEALDARKWGELIPCAEQLRKLDRMAGERLYLTAHGEMKAEAALRTLTNAIKDRSLPRAKAALDQISTESVYRREAMDQFSKLDSEPPKAPAKCDSEALILKGQAAFVENRPTDALAFYEAAYKCRRSDQTLRYLVAAACKAKNLAKGRQYWKLLSQPGKDVMLSLCAANGIFEKDLSQ
jgi:hypothetical protein